MDFAPDNVERVRRFWAAERMATRPGLKAVDLFRQVGAGKVKALWIMATNPAVSMPDAGAVREALAACPFVVVSDCIAETDTSAFAHVKFPATGWGEKDGTVTNSERVVSRQRPFLAAPGEARHDWWIVTQVAQRMGWRNAFAYRSPADIFREHARLSAYQNGGARLFDIGTHAAIGNEAYDRLEPFRWGGRPFADGRFPTPDGRARLVPVEQLPAADPLRDWPLTLNTGRYRDQWHTMTRTGLSPRLARHRQEPLVEIHPDDAERLGIVEGDLARVATPQGESLFRAQLNPGQRPGEIFTPIHWTDRQSTGGRTGLLARALTDPHSGQPGFKSAPARIERFAPAWRGFLVAVEEPPPARLAYATRVRVAGGWLVEFAGEGDPARAVEQLLPPGARVETADAARGSYRVAVLAGGRLSAALYITRDGALPSRDWLAEQLGEAGAQPLELLAGRPSAPRPDRGPIVCACFDVGLNTILSAIATQSLTSVEAVGGALRAGTNCGSCRPAIQNLLAREAAHG
jgi:assimilatory nitrate reductase catalytic subunit